MRTLQRWQTKGEDISDKRAGSHGKPSHGLTQAEREELIYVANSKEYADSPPCQIVPKLADKGIYLASESTFYRVLKSEHQLHRRGKQKAPTHSKPKSLVATKPNQVWSWDISYLPTTVQGLFYYLYFFLDIFSRKIVGFGVFQTERATHAEQVIEQACHAENILKQQIHLHSDNGSPMKASTFLVTLHRLGITPSYSRPSVSNDNPYSEALFKTTNIAAGIRKNPLSI